MTRGTPTEAPERQARRPFASRRNPTDTTRARSILAAQAAAAKNGTDTVVLEVGDIIGIADTFVITSAGNVRQVRAIAEEVEHRIHEAGFGKPFQVEGRSDATWVLIDYGDVIVHVFLAETREYYALERLWGDAPTLEWEETAAAVS